MVFILGLFFRKYKNRIEYKKFVSPQAVRNILTEIENKLAESNELRKEIDEIKCKL
ncbi:hypothetical protein [Candidatus Desulfofervidus auxilii]|uniref:hypothetical protein n=1 Tax=Desulfofervidus auxilii TaxID=1621989 RepID=UPI0012E751D2|nr:hypothetical protein [Candidatus Desulfofervidus auxilii]